MAKRSGRQCLEKGYRYIKSANKCMKSCSGKSYRSKKSPYHCQTPKRKNRPKCPQGMRRSSKTRQCVSKYKLLTYKSRRR